MVYSLGSLNTDVRSTTLKILIKLIECVPRRVTHLVLTQIIRQYDSFFNVVLMIFEDIIPAEDAVKIVSYVCDFKDSLSTSLCFDFVYSIVTSTAFTELPGVSKFASTKWWTELSASHALSPFFNVFVFRLVQWFKRRNEAAEMSSVVIELGKRVDPSTLFSSFAIIISFDEDRSFIAKSVKVLNIAMMTCPVFFSMRSVLMTFDSPSAQSLFQTLYKTWAYSPVSLATLCLLTKNYEHALWLVECFPLIELNLELLVDIDKLVQLIELPVFAYLRLHLVNPSQNASLFKCLYGLLMLMPQTSSFKTLYKRLKCVPPFLISPNLPNSTNTDLDHLKTHFLAIHGFR